MNAINFKHSIIFFNLCILLSPLNNIINLELTIVCLFLILIIGISHGSLDNVKGRKLLNIFNIKSEYIFYVGYLTTSFLIIIFWLIFPNVILLFFLIVASYHFGKEDTVFSSNKKLFINEILFFFKGSSIIIAPLFFQREATYEIFRTLNFYVFEATLFDDVFLLIFISASFLSNFFISKRKDFNLKTLLFIDFLSVIILNYFLNPILAFTLYFCFLHSIRHSITLAFELDKSVKKGFKKFISKAVPLTLVTGFSFLITIYFLSNFYELNEAIYKVIFIGLASLTFPHILLEYLLEKNEKRS